VSVLLALVRVFVLVDVIVELVNIVVVVLKPELG
jgi:hypothetical protein